MDPGSWLRRRGLDGRCGRAPQPHFETLSVPSHPLRIALAIEHFSPLAGGAEGVAWHTARGLAAAGDRVHVFARRAEPSAGIKIHRVIAPRAWQPLRVLAFSRAVARATRSGRFDFAYSLARTAVQDVYRAGAGCHADYLSRRYGGAGLGLRRASPRHRTLMALEGRVFRDPLQHVICNSEMVRREIRRRYSVPEERLTILRNGVDLEIHHPRRRPDAREKLRAAIDPQAEAAAPVWLFAGNGFERKGLDTALLALARAARSDLRLWVAGGDEPSAWRERARRLGLGSRVRFLGWRSDLPDVLAAADGLLLPTRYDAFANVCLEAAAAGIPVVTSTANGAAELFTSISPCVFEPEDAEGQARALDILSDSTASVKVGLAMRLIAETHSWDTHIGALRSLFAKLGRRP